MSAYYAIKAILSVEFSGNRVKEILETGKNLGFKYYYYNDLPQIKDIAQLSVKDAVGVIIKNIDDIDEPSCILAQINDTFCHIFFRKTEENDLNVTISFFAYIWEVETKEGYSFIDFSRYIKVFLPMIEAFVIKSFETIIE